MKLPDLLPTQSKNRNRHLWSAFPQSFLQYADGSSRIPALDGDYSNHLALTANRVLLCTEAIGLVAIV